VAVCIMGMISASLFVVFLQQLIEFNPKEQKVGVFMFTSVVLLRVQEARDHEQLH
jgi:hypothetical protein